VVAQAIKAALVMVWVIWLAWAVRRGQKAVTHVRSAVAGDYAINARYTGRYWSTSHEMRSSRHQMSEP